MTLAGLQRIKMYDAAGHIIANHTHSHPNFALTPFPDYIEDFRKAHTILVDFSNFRKLFRFLFLSEGETDF